jgi:hypothetical protein
MGLNNRSLNGPVGLVKRIPFRAFVLVIGVANQLVLGGAGRRRVFILYLI